MQDSHSAAQSLPPKLVLALGKEPAFRPGTRVRTRSPIGLYYERWIATFANILFQKGILTPEDLAVKMQQVEARWACDDGS